MQESLALAGSVYSLIENIRRSEEDMEAYAPGYRPLHVEVRRIQREMRKIGKDIDELEEQRQRISFEPPVDQDRIERIQQRIAGLEAERDKLEAGIPDTWTDARAKFDALSKAETRARRQYRQAVDASYETIQLLRKMIAGVPALAATQERFDPLIELIREQTPEAGLDAIGQVEDALDRLPETYRVTSKLSRAKRELRGTSPDKEVAVAEILRAVEILQAEIKWRQRAAAELSAELDAYDKAIAKTIGMRLQQRLTADQAESVATCLAVHKDLTLYF